MTEVDGPLSMREQQRAFTRRRLMEVAQQLFAAQGYPETTVDDIARAAGVNKALIYRSFDSKEEIFVLVLADYLACRDRVSIIIGPGASEPPEAE